MTEALMEVNSDGSASLFHGRRKYRREPGDSKVRWLQWDGEEFTAVSESKAQQLEPIFQNAGLVKPLIRSPRLPDLLPDQPIYCPAFGFGAIVSVEGDISTVKFGDDERQLATTELVTLFRAIENWYDHWLPGKKRRLREGKRLWIIKSLCRYTEWQAFLDRYDYPRASADDLIRRYRATLSQDLPGYRANDPEAHSHESTDDAISALAEEEVEKRYGKTPSYHPTLWSLRIKLPAPVLELCRRKYKAEIDDAKEFFRRAAFLFVGLDPDDDGSHSGSSE